MDVAINLRPDASTPIYLQIRYQLAYAITSGQLREGHRLPTVRALADQLGVNPGTVSQAYQELQQQGLLEAAPGRGTFVATTLPTRVDSLTRQRFLDEAIQSILLRAWSLGYSDEEIRLHLQLAMSSSATSRHVVFAAPTLAIASKYAASIESRLGRALTVLPATFDAIASRSPYLAALLQTAYFVITFAGFTRSVERDLAAFSSPTRLLGCSTEVQQHTLATLRAVDPSERLCLVTQEPYLLPTLNLIAAQTGRAIDDIEVCLDGDTAKAGSVLPNIDRVVYTYAARDFVIKLGVPAARQIEVVFDLTDESIERLRGLLLPGETARTPVHAENDALPEVP